MTLLEDWPSLPPIRTSSGRDSRVSCETLSFHDSAPPSSSFPPSSDMPLSAHKLDTFFQHPASADASPPSSATSGFGFVPPSTTTGRRGVLPCFFPNKSASHALSKAMMSPGREGKKGASDVGTVLRSFVGFSAQIHQTGPIAHSGAITHSNKVGSGPISGHSVGLKGYSGNSKGHAANVFTMMPPDVVGKKKPPGYESDEPTSPEVTCIGRVRRKKHCKAWDALVKETNYGGKKGKGKKPGFDSPRKLNFVRLSPRAEKQFESPGKSMPLRWTQPVLHGSGTESQVSDLQRQLNVEDLSSDLGRFSLTSGLFSQVSDLDISLSSSFNGEQFPSEEETSDVTDEGVDFPYQRPPVNCLLRMRNTGHSKEHRAYGDLFEVASESTISMGKHAGSKSSSNTSLWKRRMAQPEPLKLEMKGKR